MATSTLHELIVCIPGVCICVFVVASCEIKQLVTDCYGNDQVKNLTNVHLFAFLYLTCFVVGLLKFHKRQEVVIFVTYYQKSSKVCSYNYVFFFSATYTQADR